MSLLLPATAAFHLPEGAHGAPAHYFCGNSLGLMPIAARAAVEEVLWKWQHQAVEGHFLDPAPWMPYHERVRNGLAVLAGARPDEVVAMNSLTANLHLLLASFYRPQPGRAAILIERGAFPSDRHAVASQIAFHGYDPNQCLIEFGPERATGLIGEAEVEALLADRADIALVLWPGVQYVTGQRFDLARLARAAQAAGAVFGTDLAHAIGNVPVDLHAAGVDFAVWCSYKYLNSGPGAVAGAFVHQRHHDADLPRLAGWWGHDPATRFAMGPEFVPARGADGWQLSNPPILGLAPLTASLPLFVEAGLPALRARSEVLTARLEQGLAAFERQLEQITPRDPARRGCQLSIRVRAGRSAGRTLFEALGAAGVIVDWREPDVIRMAPTPLYSTEADVDALLAVVARQLD
jgi:kynureninase